MSYSLEFLTVEFDSLQKFFAEGDSVVRQAVIELGDEIYAGAEDNEEMKEARFVWSEIVTSMSGGNLGQYLAAQKYYETFNDRNDRMSHVKSLAFAAIARHFCEAIAGIHHSSSGGEIFRTEPFEYLKQSGFLGRIDPFLLIERPLFNQIPDSFPGWGGLSRDELASISTDDLNNAQADSGDSEVDIWVNGILNLTEEAKLRGLDLITIYE